MPRPTIATVKRLFAVSSNRCAFPGCTAPLVTGDTVTAEICHIKAQNAGGPRYDPAQSDKQRHGFDNLLLMCGDHHKVIDADPVTYTVERLHEIKTEHEARYAGGPQPTDEIARQFLVQVDIHGDQFVTSVETAGIVHSGKGDIHVHPPSTITSSPSYIPPPPPPSGTFPEPGDLPPGSRIPFLRNALFTGRVKSLETLARGLLYDKAPRTLVTQVVHGMGGVGKTQLAIEFAYRYGRFFHGVHWLNAGEPDRLGTEVAACGAAMNLSNWPEAQPDQITRTVSEWRSGGRRLVVLDNLENLKAARTWLARLGGGPVRLLLTARRTYWPADLGLKRLRLNVFNPQESRAFLRSHLPQEQATDEDLDRLTDRLGHLALALELAGRFLKHHRHLTVNGYLDQLESVLNHRSMQNWRAELGNATDHDLNLVRTFEMSWNWVTDGDARHLFLLAGHCAPNQAIPDALLQQASQLGVQACDEALDFLIGLGLLETEELAADLVIHPLLAEYARIKAHQEQASPLIPLARALEKLVREARESGRLGSLVALRPHMEQVVEAVEATGIEEIALTLWDSLGDHRKAVADYGKAQKAYERALAIAKQLYESDQHQIATRASKLGAVLRDQGKLRKALRCFERAQALDETALGPDHPGIAVHLHNKGYILKDLNRLEEAEAALAQAVDQLQKALDDGGFSPDPSTLAHYIHSLGWVLRDVGDLVGARDCFSESLRMIEGVFGPDDGRIIPYLDSLGWLLKDLAQWREARDAFERALSIRKAAYGPEHPDVARSLKNVGWVLRDQGNWRDAQAVFERALSIWQAAYGEMNAHVATAHDDLGTVFLDLRDFARAQENFQRALEIDQMVFGPGYPAVARDLRSLSQALTAQGGDDGAVQCIRQALEIDERHYNPSHPNVANHTRDVGWMLKDRDNLGGAWYCFRYALAIDEDFFGPDRSEVVLNLHGLGWVRKDQGYLEKAAEHFGRALRADSDTFGLLHPRVACDKRNIGWVRKDQGNLAQAAELFREALNTDERLFGPEHPNIACNLRNVGWLFKDQGDLTGAAGHFQQALKIDEAYFGPNHPSVIPDVSGLGHVLCDQGDLGGARDCFERAVAVDEFAYGPSHVCVARDLKILGGIHRIQGDAVAALACFDRALRIDEATFGPDSPIVAATAYKQGIVLRDLGKPKTAREAFERALAIFQKRLPSDHPNIQTVRKSLEELAR